MKSFQRGVLSGAADSRGTYVRRVQVYRNCAIFEMVTHYVCVCVYSGTCLSPPLAVKHYTLGRRLTVVTCKYVKLMYYISLLFTLVDYVCALIISDAGLGEVFSCDSSCLNQDLAKGASSSQRMSTVRAACFY